MTIRFIGSLLCGAVFALVTTTDVVAKLGANVGGGIGRDHLAKKPVAPKKARDNVAAANKEHSHRPRR
jgi:hypothetical protein